MGRSRLMPHDTPQPQPQSGEVAKQVVQWGKSVPTVEVTNHQSEYNGQSRRTIFSMKRALQLLNLSSSFSFAL